MTPRIIQVGDKDYRATLMLLKKGWGIYLDQRHVNTVPTLAIAVEFCRKMGIDTRIQETIS